MYVPAIRRKVHLAYQKARWRSYLKPVSFPQIYRSGKWVCEGEWFVCLEFGQYSGSEKWKWPFISDSALISTVIWRVTESQLWRAPVTREREQQPWLASVMSHMLITVGCFPSICRSGSTQAKGGRRFKTATVQKRFTRGGRVSSVTVKWEREEHIKTPQLMMSHFAHLGSQMHLCFSPHSPENLRFLASLTLRMAPRACSSTVSLWSSLSLRDPLWKSGRENRLVIKYNDKAPTYETMKPS